MINFYRRFLPAAATTMLPLFEALNSNVLSWTDSMEETFTNVKSALAQSTLLVHSCLNAPIAITTHLIWAVGTVLQQLTNNQWVPLAFFSQKLKSSEKKYSTIDRELLALYLHVHVGIQQFCCFRRSTIHCFYRPQTSHILPTYPWCNRQQRHLAYISELTTETHLGKRQSSI